MIEGHEEQEGDDTNDYIEHDSVGSRKGRHRRDKAGLYLCEGEQAGCLIKCELNHGLEL